MTPPVGSFILDRMTSFVPFGCLGVFVVQPIKKLSKNILGCASLLLRNSSHPFFRNSPKNR